MKFRPRARWALLLPLIFAPLLPGNPLLGQAVAQDASSPQDDAAKRLQWLKSKGLAGSTAPAKPAATPASNTNANANATAGAAILKKRFSETRSQQLRPIETPAPAEGNTVAKKPSTPAASGKAVASAPPAATGTGAESTASKPAATARETANSKSTGAKDTATAKVPSKEKEATAKTAGTKEPAGKEATGTTPVAKESATAKTTSKEKETAAKTAGTKEPASKEPTAATKEGAAATAATAKSASAKEGAATSKTAATKEATAPKTTSTDDATASTAAAKGKKSSGSEKTTASAVGAGPATPTTAKGATSEKVSGTKGAKTVSAAPVNESAVAVTKETAAKGSATKEKETAASTAKTKDQPTKETKAAALAAAKSEAAAEAAKKTAASEKTTGKEKEKGTVATLTTKSEPQSPAAKATDTAATRALLKTPATAAIPSTSGSTRGSKTPTAPTSLTNPESLMPSRTAASNNVTITTRTMGASSRYPWKSNIVTTVFWVGERPAGNNFTPNYASSWDAAWSRSYGGFDNPDPDHRRNFIPIKFTPRQNPFYVALPYNDVTRGTTKPEARRVIPWFRDAYTREGQSVCHNRWVAIRSRSGRIAYAQWSDCGPFRTDHWQYVFGNERPKPNLNQGAGLDVSPAVRDYLGLAGTDVTDWRFVDTREVPHGPWAIYGDNNTCRRNGPRMASKEKSEAGRKGSLTVAQVP